MAGRALILRAEPGFSLPAFERFAPPPTPAVVAARIEAHTAPGDVVVDLHGRGGWIARGAIDRQRRAVSLEATPLDRLLAEVVLRPPDLRHLDAAVQTLAASPRRESSLKPSIGELYASRCATCGRPIVLDEVAWETIPEGVDELPDGILPGILEDTSGHRSRPVRKHYRCIVCRDQQSGGEQRHAPLDPSDLARALASEEADDTRERLRDRFPVPDEADGLVDALLDLHTPRQLVALGAILERIDGELRAAPVAAALRLAFLHALAPASRLATGPGRTTVPRIVGGRLRPPHAATWRERNPWLAFEDGVRVVRGFVQRLESGLYGPVPARLGDDLRSLGEGSASVVLKVATPAAYGALGIEGEQLSRAAVRPKVRLVLGAPPLRPSADRLAWTFHATAWVLGREAASLLPLEPLFGAAGRPPWGWQAAALARSLRAVEPMLDRDARVVLLVDGEGPEALIAAALAGVLAGHRVVAARLAEPGRNVGGIVELVPPGSWAVPGGPRTRANVPLEPLPGAAGDPDLRPAAGLFAAAERVTDAPFSADEAGRAIVDGVVDVLKVRGEPVRFDGLLGEVLVSLDRAGLLRRFMRPLGGAGGEVSTDKAPESPATGPAASTTVGDPVDRLLKLIRGALGDADGQRLIRTDGHRWWLADRSDRDAAAVPLADRVEWAVYSLLSTAGPLSETAFYERIATLFSGADLPDEALVHACLDSYRGLASTPDRIVTADDVLRRSQEHGELLATIADLGHRMGFSVWLGRRQQTRRAGGQPLGRRLDRRELAGPPYLGGVRQEDMEEVDAIWYVRGRMAFMWEVEWTAMLSETVLRRHGRIPADERLVRFLVVLPERVELVRHKIERSPLLRDALADGGWHLLKSTHLRAWAARDDPHLDDLEPLLGLDPRVERSGEQLDLFS
jgi:hypothetical protein